MSLNLIPHNTVNPFGSYRALLGNSTSAMLAAIEIYNKPQFNYRSECFVILLLNAWELAFKALLSKNRIRIFLPKEHNRPYMTLGLYEAMERCEALFPKNIAYRPVAENISRLADYRNNAVHFYNETGFEIVIYGLAQTSIVNFRDLVAASFDKDIASEVNISLLPLSFGASPDPITFLRQPEMPGRKPAVAEFLRIISDTTSDLEKDGVDTGRFLTVFQVHLQSTKKIQSADVVAGISADNPKGILLVAKKIDPNNSHPHPRKKILQLVGEHINGVKFTSRTFDALVWRYSLKANESLCWHNESNNTYQYSPELASHLRSYSKVNIDDALKAYSTHIGDSLKAKRASKAKPQ